MTMATTWQVSVCFTTSAGTEIVVHGTYHAASRGAWYARNGDPGDPPEPARWEPTRARLDVPSKAPVAFDLALLCEEDLERLHDLALSEAAEQDPDPDADADGDGDGDGDGDVRRDALTRQEER
jgi:hypothetical protein